MLTAVKLELRVIQDTLEEILSLLKLVKKKKKKLNSTKHFSTCSTIGSFYFLYTL